MVRHIRVPIFMPAGVPSGDIAQNYLLEPLSQAAATQLYRKDTKKPSISSSYFLAQKSFRAEMAASRELLEPEKRRQPRRRWSAGAIKKRDRRQI
jgi:hypothetical protein